MTTIRAFFLQIRALFSNFQKRAGETSPLPPLVTRLYPSIKEQLLKESLDSPNRYVITTDNDKKIINHARKPLLFN